MKLYFMKKEALDILKSNLDMVYCIYRPVSAHCTAF